MYQLLQLSLSLSMLIVIGTCVVVCCCQSDRPLDCCCHCYHCYCYCYQTSGHKWSCLDLHWWRGGSKVRQSYRLPTLLLLPVCTMCHHILLLLHPHFHHHCHHADHLWGASLNRSAGAGEPSRQSKSNHSRLIWHIYEIYVIYVIYVIYMTYMTHICGFHRWSWLVTMGHHLENAKDDKGCEVERENLAAGCSSRKHLKSQMSKTKSA